MTVEYCPVSMGVNLLGDKWSLLIVREIITGAHNFNAIHRGLPGISRTLLASRLRFLERAELVVKLDREYHTTPAGSDLLGVLMSLGSWTARWRFPAPTEEQADPYLLLWRMRAGLDISRLPNNRRTTLHFAFTEPRVHGWIVVDNGKATLCYQDPRFPVDVAVSGTVNTWNQIWYGHRTFASARQSGEIDLAGATPLTSAFFSWFELSPFAQQITDAVGHNVTQEVRAS
ncbi:helix-turn-helix domain-containing protein [Rhodococcus sp. NPDC006774]|jgi:DNA-binding HxlR family transcriptional regulator|uniref:winged helix-turn-helix transcriptional regulator n=1 Tax=Rhodococcus sp. NPDC006774 TaxID=3157186 RepID=UPI0033C519CF